MAGYQIKVMMEGTKPPMWRRLIVPDRITFEALHQTLQIAFGWIGYHLHDFEFQHRYDRVGNMESADVEYEEKDYLIDDVLKEGWIRYTYDFGDNWQHKIVLEKQVADYKHRYPQVIKYRRNNFDEDSGGVWDAEACGDYDEYDMAEVNDELQTTCVFQVSRRYRQLPEYEDQPDLKKYLPEDTWKKLEEYQRLMEAAILAAENNKRKASTEEPEVDDEINNSALFMRKQ